MSSHKKHINIILWNAISVKNKISELHKFLTDHDVDIAIITENWLTPKDTFKLLNYKIHRQSGPPSINNKPRSGILIAVHKNILTEDTPQPATSNIEVLTIKLKTTPKLTVGTAYSPSSRNKHFRRSGRHRIAIRTLHHRR